MRKAEEEEEEVNDEKEMREVKLEQRRGKGIMEKELEKREELGKHR